MIFKIKINYANKSIKRIRIKKSTNTNIWG